MNRHYISRTLPTKYGQCVFRSRLEARWAVYLDLLQFPWAYEPEGFHLSNGVCYLPDFVFPAWRESEYPVYGEVKPTKAHFESECMFAQRFCDEVGAGLVALIGPPSINLCSFFTPKDTHFEGVVEGVVFCEYAFLFKKWGRPYFGEEPLDIFDDEDAWKIAANYSFE